MKSHELLDAVGHIDGRYAEAAAGGKKISKSLTVWTAAAACLVLLIVGLPKLRREEPEPTQPGSETTVPATDPAPTKSHEGGQAAVNLFFPNTLMRTDGKWIYIASAETKMLYIYRADGADTAKLTEIKVDLPFETDPEQDEVDFVELYVQDGIIYLLGTREPHRIEWQGDTKHSGIGPRSVYLAVYSFEDQQSLKRIALIDQSGDLDIYDWELATREEGGTLVAEGGKVYLTTRVNFMPDEPLEEVYYTINGKKTVVGPEETGIPDNFSDVLYMMTEFDLNGNMSLVFTELGKPVKTDAWLLERKCVQTDWYIPPHTEDHDIEEWGRVFVQTEWYGGETLGVYTFELIGDTADKTSFAGGWGFRIGDLLYVEENTVDYGSFLSVITPDTLQVLAMIRFE